MHREFCWFTIITDQFRQMIQRDIESGTTRMSKRTDPRKQAHAGFDKGSCLLQRRNRELKGEDCDSKGVGVVRDNVLTLEDGGEASHTLGGAGKGGT
jgi:hypothetical protein